MKSCGSGGVWHCSVRQKAVQTRVPCGTQTQLKVWLQILLAKLWYEPPWCLTDYIPIFIPILFRTGMNMCNIFGFRCGFFQKLWTIVFKVITQHLWADLSNLPNVQMESEFLEGNWSALLLSNTWWQCVNAESSDTLRIL